MAMAGSQRRKSRSGTRKRTPRRRNCRQDSSRAATSTGWVHLPRQCYLSPTLRDVFLVFSGLLIFHLVPASRAWLACPCSVPPVPSAFRSEWLHRLAGVRRAEGLRALNCLDAPTRRVKKVQGVLLCVEAYGYAHCPSSLGSCVTHSIIEIVFSEYAESERSIQSNSSNFV